MLSAATQPVQAPMCGPDTLDEAERSLVEAFIDSALHDEFAAPRGLPERLIALLDEIDGDCDSEIDPAGDDGLYYFNDGWREGWGSRDEDAGHFFPQYGIDQTQSPLNWCGTFREGWGA